MARPLNTIKLLAAQHIFSDCGVVAVEAFGKTAGYRASHPVLGDFENQYLTALCVEIWKAAMEKLSKASA